MGQASLTVSPEIERKKLVAKSTKKIVMEIVKAFVYVGLGMIAGVILNSSVTVLIKSLGVIAVVIVAALLAVLFIVSDKKDHKASATRISNAVPQQSARVSRGSDYPERREKLETTQNVTQSNPLDRRPMSAEKKEQHERNKKKATKVVLINEEGRPLMDWSLERKTSLIIGKSTEGDMVDIDLTDSAVAQMISKQHAVLNYTEKGWYVDDIDSKNGTRVKKLMQNAIMDVKLVGAIEVEPGDIIYIANTMLQIQ